MRTGFACPCGHAWMLHDVGEYDGDGSDLCCVQGCDQTACPGHEAKIIVLSCENAAPDTGEEKP